MVNKKALTDSNLEGCITAIQAKIKESDYLAAAPLCTEALKLHPENPCLLEIAGDCAFRLWDNKNAADRFAKLARQAPENLNVLLRLGEVYERLEQFEKAKASATQILRLDPTNVPVRLLLGRCIAAQGDWSKAIEHLHIGEAIHNAASTSALVRALISLGRREDAVNVLRKITSPFPKGADVFDSPLPVQTAEIAFEAASAGEIAIVKDLAQVLVLLGDIERAEVLFQFVSEAAPDDLNHEMLYARFLTDTERSAKAIERLRNVSLRPHVGPEEWRNLAWTFSYCGALTDAWESIERCASDGSSICELLLAIALDLRTRQDEDRALTIFQMGLSKHPESDLMETSFVNFVLESGDKSTILNRLSHTKDLQNVDRIGKLLLERREWHLAGEAFNRALLLDPHHPVAQSHLDFARAMINLDKALDEKQSWRLGDALEHVNAAINLLPQADSSALHCRGEICHELGDFNAAVRDHETAVAITPSEHGRRLLRESQSRLASHLGVNDLLGKIENAESTAHRNASDLAEAISLGVAKLNALPLARYPISEKTYHQVTSTQQSPFVSALKLAQAGRTIEAITTLSACLDSSTQLIATKLLLTSDKSYEFSEIQLPQSDTCQNWLTLCEMAYRLNESPFQQAALFALERGTTAVRALKSSLKEGCPYTGRPDWAVWKRSVADQALIDISPQLPGHVRLSRGARIATAGSCFAQNIARYLPKWGYSTILTEPGPVHLSEGERKRRGYGIYPARFGNVYTSLQLLQLIERAYGRIQPVEDVWVDPDGLKDPFRPQLEPSFQSLEALQADRSIHFKAVREMFETLDIFIFTLGLTEAWLSRQDGVAFPVCPGCGGGKFDPSKHQFVNFRVADVVRHMDLFFARLAEVNPNAKILLTVSPVPLIATMEDRHVLSSTICSKSILRAAADELASNHAHVEYFGAYEIVTSTFQTHNYYASDRRNVTEQAIDHVMKTFASTFLSDESMETAVEAQTKTGPAVLRTEEAQNSLQDVPTIFCQEEQFYGGEFSDLEILTRADVEFYAGDAIHLFWHAPKGSRDDDYGCRLKERHQDRAVLYRDANEWLQQFIQETNTRPWVLCMGSSQTMNCVNWPFYLHQDLQELSTSNPVVLNLGMAGSTSLESLWTFRALCKLLDRAKASFPLIAVSMIGCTDIAYRATRFYGHALGIESMPITFRELEFLKQSNAIDLIVEPGTLSVEETTFENPSDRSPFAHVAFPEGWQANIVNRASRSICALDAAITRSGIHSYMFLQPISTRKMESDYGSRARNLYAAAKSSTNTNFLTWRLEKGIFSHTGEYRDAFGKTDSPSDSLNPALDLDNLYQRLRDVWRHGTFATRPDCFDLMELRFDSEELQQGKSLFTKDAVHYESEGSRRLGGLVARHTRTLV